MVAYPDGVPESEVVRSVEVPADEPTQSVIPSLSPSRAADFKTCPLLYRFRSIDRIPEAPSSAATRGTVVHGVLEDLFDLPSAERTPDAAAAMVAPQWRKLLDQEPELAELFADDTDHSRLDEWLKSAESLVRAYFQLEDPTRFEPAGREQYVETTLESGLRLRGYIDRLDEAPDGRVRVVDYKSGAAPREAFEAKALFQMKFYALIVWKTTGTIPAQLKLMYLSDIDELTYSPDERELLALERQLGALWSAIEKSIATKDFRPSPSRLCDWCDHKSRCPAFGGTLPEFPAHALAASAVDRRTENANAD